MSPIGGAPGGGDQQRALADYLRGLGVPWQQMPGEKAFLAVEESSEEPVVISFTEHSNEKITLIGFVDKKPSASGDDSSQPDAATANVIAESLAESVKETSGWAVETVLKIGAHCINPVLGHMVTIRGSAKS